MKFSQILVKVRLKNLKTPKTSIKQKCYPQESLIWMVSTTHSNSKIFHPSETQIFILSSSSALVLNCVENSGNFGLFSLSYLSFCFCLSFLFNKWDTDRWKLSLISCWILGIFQRLDCGNCSGFSIVFITSFERLFRKWY